MFNVMGASSWFMDTQDLTRTRKLQICFCWHNSLGFYFCIIHMTTLFWHLNIIWSYCILRSFSFLLSALALNIEIGSIGIKPFEEIFMLNFNMHKNYLISANGLQWKFNASVSVSISIAPSFIPLLAMQNFFVQM